MRIAHVNAYHYPFIGGIEHRIHHICKRLAKDHEVYVVTSRLPNTTEREDIDGYHVVRVPTRFLGNYNPPIALISGVAKALQDIAPEVIDFHYRWSPAMTRGVLKQQCPLVFTCHNIYGEGSGVIGGLSHINDRLFRRHVERFERIAYVSEFLRTNFLAHGYPDHDNDCVPNGVELKQGAPEAEHLLAIGRMVDTKGFDVLIEAMQEVDGKLVLAGDGPIRNRLLRQVKRLGLEQKVSLPGKVSEAEKERLMSTCRALVVPSTFEAFGIVAAEGMAYGRPVVASRTGGLVEVVGDAGLLVTPGDSKELAGTLNEILGDRKRCAEMGKRARERAAFYSWDRTASDMLKCYEKAVQARDSKSKR